MNRLMAIFALLVFAASPVLGQSVNTPSATPIKSSRPRVPADIEQALLAGKPQDVLVEYDDSGIQSRAIEMRKKYEPDKDDTTVLDFKKSAYAKLKNSVMSGVSANDYENLLEYSHLPLAFVRLKTPAALKALLADPRVKAIHKNGRISPELDLVSAGFVNQPVVSSRGLIGTGATVAVIDTGVNYTLADFGHCTSPGVPSGCKVNYYGNFSGATLTGLDSMGHGTNVSGIVVGVAPGVNVAALNVFGPNATTSDAYIISAMNWAIANATTYHIVSMNLSLGDGVNHGNGLSTDGSVSDCTTTAYVGVISQAKAVGINVYVASGNNMFSNGVSSPACTLGATAVGALYDASYGTVTYSMCSDPNPVANQTTCFTNLPPAGSGAAYNFVMAPGFNITAGGITDSGTSQATPFISAANAIVRAAVPVLTAVQAATPTNSTDMVFVNGCSHWALVPITRSGYSGTAQKLDLVKYVYDCNDNFSVTSTPSFASNSQLVGNNVFATKESGEPNIAGNAGGHSVWVDYTPTVTSPINVDTHNSGFDTLLAVYTGSSVSALTPIASNDDDGSPGGTSSLVFQGVAGTNYKITVDGKNGMVGNYVLNVQYGSADLGLTLTSAVDGTLTSILYGVGIVNAGPGIATHVTVNVTLPAGVTLDTARAGGCTTNGSAVSCLLGTLLPLAGANVSFYGNVSGLGSYSATATVSSDLTDPSASDDTATTLTAVETDNDVPTLPGWGAILMGGLLLAAMQIKARSNRRH